MYCYISLPLDLHVLGLPLAFILSQDQTLHCNNILLKRIVLFFYLYSYSLVLFYYKHATLGFCDFNLLSQPLEDCSPSQLRVQRYELFLFYQTFFHLFRKLFYNYSDYQYHFSQTFFRNIPLFSRFFTLFFSNFNIFDLSYVHFWTKCVYCIIYQ